MSRIARTPFAIPKDVFVKFHDHVLTVEKGSSRLNFNVPQGISIKLDDQKLQVFNENPHQKSTALVGTVFRISSNMIKGIVKEFEADLELVGVGYKGEIQGSHLKLSLGYSHDILYPIPNDVRIVAEKPTLLKLFSMDKQRLGQVKREIMAFRKSEPYKGKGVNDPKIFIRRKEGKTKK